MIDDPPGRELAPSLREHIHVLKVVTRPVEERPTHDTIDNIAEWLVGPVPKIEEGTASFDEFAWRLLATGMPLLRVTFHTGTTHPHFFGFFFNDTATTERQSRS